MNNFAGHIDKIEVSGNLSLVSVCILDEINLQAIVVDTPDTASYLQIGNRIRVLFKETEVFLGLGEDIPVSVQNRIKGVVVSIEKGTLLSSVVIQTTVGNLVSVISTKAVNQLNLKQSITVTAFIKLNEIMLATNEF